MRENPLGHRFVVTDQVELRQTRARVDDALWVRHLRPAWRGRRWSQRHRIRWIGCSFARDGLGRLVDAQSDERGVTDLPVRRPLGKLDISNETWLEPTLATGHALRPTTRLLDHYPEDLRWAMLSAPPLLKEFYSTPFKTSAFNRNYITSFKPKSGVIEAAIGDTVTIELESNRYKKLLWVTDIANVDSNTIFVLQCCGVSRPENVINGNKISATYKVINSDAEWLNIIYDDELIMRYKLNIKKDITLTQDTPKNSF